MSAAAGGGVVEGYPHDLQGEKMLSQFLYSATRSFTRRSVSTRSRRVTLVNAHPLRSLSDSGLRC